MGVCRTTWAVAGCCTVIVGGMALASWTHRASDDLRLELERKVAAILARQPAPVYRDSALWGETLAGEASTHYASAVAAQGTLEIIRWNAKAGEFLEGGAAVPRERQERLREQWAPFLDAVRAGAHRKVAPPSTWQMGRLGNVDAALTLELRSRLREGRTEAFLELWLDAFTCAVDYWLATSGNWREQWPRNLLHLLDDDVLRSLPAQQLEQLEQCLGNADRLAATPIDPMAILAQWIEHRLRTAHLTRHGVRSHLAAWQHGFDPLRADLLGFDELLDLQSLLEPAATDAAARAAQWAAYRAAPRPRITPLSDQYHQLLEAAERQHLQVVAQMRVLRIAANFHRGGELPVLADPFAAGPLQVQVDGDEATIGSASRFDGSQRIARRR